MLSPLLFTKMQGLGNDFVVIDDLGSVPATQGLDLGKLAKKICDRRFGIGADQILWLKKSRSSVADIRMEILNADGSEAEMCGNGIRAVARYLQRHTGLKRPESSSSVLPSYLIETLGGVKKVELMGNEVIVDMGAPTLGKGFLGQGEELVVAGERLFFYEVNVGNPHAVFFVNALSQFPVETLGPLIEKHPRFPQRTNVEFVEVGDGHSIRVRVWERGAGITLACGTGACASAVASLATQKVSGRVEVLLPGGALQITWSGKVTDSVMMQGPAEEVFQGRFLFE